MLNIEWTFHAVNRNRMVHFTQFTLAHGRSTGKGLGLGLGVVP